MPKHTAAEKSKNKKAKKSNLAPPFEKKSKKKKGK